MTQMLHLSGMMWGLNEDSEFLICGEDKARAYQQLCAWLSDQEPDWLRLTITDHGMTSDGYVLWVNGSVYGRPLSPLGLT